MSCSLPPVSVSHVSSARPGFTSVEVGELKCVCVSYANANGFSVRWRLTPLPRQRSMSDGCDPRDEFLSTGRHRLHYPRQAHVVNLFPCLKVSAPHSHLRKHSAAIRFITAISFTNVGRFGSTPSCVCRDDNLINSALGAVTSSPRISDT